MFAAFLTVLGAALSIWDHKLAQKYIDRKLALEKAWYEESNKPDGTRSDAILDNLEFELRILGIAFAAESRTSKT